MSNPKLVVNRTSFGAIAEGRLVAPHPTIAGAVMQSVVASPIVGVCIQPGTSWGDHRVDVQLAGIANVVAGAAIAAGAPVTSNATGHAVAAAPGAGVNVRCVGFALEAATAAGDIVRVLLAQHTMQG